MNDLPLVLVGYVPAALPLLSAVQPPGTVVIVDEPDVVRKRDVRAAVAGSPLLRELVEWEYQLPGAADELFNARPGLSPAAVVPFVEYAVPFAARLAERYGLPGAGTGAAALLRDKSLLRRVTSAAGIANPESVPVTGPADVRAFLAAHPGRAVLKPANRQASVGTMILEPTATADEVEAAWADCVRQDEGVMVPDRPVPVRMLVERFVDGHEYSVEMLVRDGNPVFANVTDKLIRPGRRPIEFGHVVPAGIPDPLWTRLRTQTAALVRAVGFGTGVVHAEWIDAGDEVYLVECAGRVAGGGITELIERAYPFPLVRHLCTLLRGDPLPEMPERARHAAAVRFVPAEAGVVRSVDGVDEACSMPGVVACRVTVSPGDEIPELRSSWDRVGSVIALAATPDEARRRAEAAQARVRIAVEPS